MSSYDRDGASGGHKPQSTPLVKEADFEDNLKSQTELEKVQQKLLLDAVTHTFLTFANGGNASHSADPLNQEFDDSVAPAATIQYLKAQVAAQVCTSSQLQ